MSVLSDGAGVLRVVSWLKWALRVYAVLSRGLLLFSVYLLYSFLFVMIVGFFIVPSGFLGCFCFKN